MLSDLTKEERDDGVFAGRIVAVTLLGVAVDQLYSIANTTTTLSGETGADVLTQAELDTVIECAKSLDELMNKMGGERETIRLQ